MDITVVITTVVLLVVAVAGTAFFTFCCWDNQKALMLRCDTNAERYYTQQREMREMRSAYEAKLLAAASTYTRKVRALAQALGYSEYTNEPTPKSTVWKKTLTKAARAKPVLMNSKDRRA